MSTEAEEARVQRVARALADAAGSWSAYVEADNLSGGYVDGLVDFVGLARVAIRAADLSAPPPGAPND